MGRRRATPSATRPSLAVSFARSCLRLRRPLRLGVIHVGAGAGVGTGAGAAGAGAVRELACRLLSSRRAGKERADIVGSRIHSRLV